MKTCILTVIKNEHEYLDEWIKYHLNLGIDHIFIFEDIDSDSHREITDKYGKRVSLDNIAMILNKCEKKRAKNIKEYKRISVQCLYFQIALSYLRDKFSDIYDWCFLIDNDEFITFENDNDNLNDILNLYKEYDAFIMSWKCFGANGLIHKPDYSNKGVIDIYDKETPIYQQVKPCYKLKSFKREFLKTHHCPTKLCNWCNTDYLKTKNYTTYNKIYLRHYITKSWDEYVWKRKIRGYIWGGKRNFDFFFEVNPDMINKKEKLINSVKTDILIVLPYKHSGAQGNELYFALSAWKKFCQFNYHFVVIGDFEEEIKVKFPWVEFIYCAPKEKKQNQYNPHLDMQNKFKIIAQRYSQIYDGFIFMTDDKYAIKPFDLKDVTSIFYHSLSFSGCEKYPTSFWKHDKWKTRQLLDRENLPHINYSTHHPCYFEFKKLKEIREKYNMLEESYVFHDVYFNYFEHEEPVLDSTIRLGIWSKDIFNRDFQNAISDPNIKFICNSVEGWSKELENELEKIVK